MGVRWGRFADMGLGVGQETVTDWVMGFGKDW